MTLAKLLKSKSYVTGSSETTELSFQVPLDYHNPDAEKLIIFARSITKIPKNELISSNKVFARDRESAPWLLYLQGGPGKSCHLPNSYGITPRLLQRGYGIMYLDQRGTGLSTPITAATLALKGSAEQQADYLKLFRADSIINDCEAIRYLITKESPDHLKRWSIFGQSYGGFCCLTYLSHYQQGLQEVFMTGGLAPIAQLPDTVYQACFSKALERNKAYYQKYPEDIQIVHTIAAHIHQKNGIMLPNGGIFSFRRFLTLGVSFGRHDGLDDVHNILLQAQSDLSQFSFLTNPTLSLLSSGFVDLDNRVIYALLHEAIYCEGFRSNWSAQRVGENIPEFSWLRKEFDFTNVEEKAPLFFSSEMIFPFMFDEYPELRILKEVAEILAQFDDWPALYDVAQLAKNEVPVYAVTYVDDLYVSFSLARKTAEMVKGLKQYITNRLDHNALKTRTAEVLGQLFLLRDHSVD